MSDLAERKARFTSELLQPLVKATDPAIESVVYTAQQSEAGPWIIELVTIHYRNGYSRPVDVGADSFLAMARDVLRVLE